MHIVIPFVKCIIWTYIQKKRIENILKVFVIGSQDDFSFLLSLAVFSIMNNYYICREKHMYLLNQQQFSFVTTILFIKVMVIS